MLTRRNQFKMQQLWAWAFATCVLAVLVLALMPSPPQAITTGWDKSNHMLAFGVMTWLGCKALPQRVLIVLLGLMAFGVLIEVAQSHTPNRSAEWLDLLADGVGVFLGWAVWRVAVRAPL